MAAWAATYPELLPPPKFSTASSAKKIAIELPWAEMLLRRRDRCGRAPDHSTGGGEESRRQHKMREGLQRHSNGDGAKPMGAAK